MKKMMMSGLVLASASGLSVAAGDVPVELEPAMGNLKHVAHIYYNIGTGEMITTLITDRDTQRPVEGDISKEIWIQTTSAMCSEYGDGSLTYFYMMDDPSNPDRLHEAILDWGGIAPDTVVDCVQVNWITNHQDVDSDSDGHADGVRGLAATWTYWDAVNGTVSVAVSECIS
ncbi:MAG: hypothetical protein JJ974_11055, partial [Phycisphaerales bacterium]|nr:hypothetical protein [Phycisphaerales bacterium]